MRYSTLSVDGNTATGSGDAFGGRKNGETGELRTQRWSDRAESEAVEMNDGVHGG